jgi:hypothetical protein
MYIEGMVWEKTNIMRISGHPSPIQVMIVQIQLENVQYFEKLGSLITDCA